MPSQVAQIKAVVAALETAGQKECAAAMMGVRFGNSGPVADGSDAYETYVDARAALTDARAEFDATLAQSGMHPSGAAYGEGINWPKSWTGKKGMVVMSSGSSSWPMVHFWSAASLKKSAQYRALCARVDREEAR